MHLDSRNLDIKLEKKTQAKLTNFMGKGHVKLPMIFRVCLAFYQVSDSLEVTSRHLWECHHQEQ